MDEIWERAVETALDGQTDRLSARTLTLDGAVKCIRLPPPSLLEKFENLQLLSIANVGVSSLEQFPKLRNLQKLNLSDNRIAGGLDSLVESGLESLRDLDLSNNRIQYIDDLTPLAELKLISLDLYECPVTRVKDYRARVFGLIKSLKYLDKMDAEENERPESDDEDEEDEEDDEDDPGSGEVDGEERFNGRIVNNGHTERCEGIVDVDEDEESDADEEETESGRGVVQAGPSQNGFDEDEGDDNEEDYNISGEEIDEDDGDGDDVVEVHDIEDESSDEDGVEDDEEDDEDFDDEEDGEDDEEEVDNDEGNLGEPESSGRLVTTDGEIDGHEQGEDEADEDEQGVEDDGDFEDEEDDESGAGYLVQRVGATELHDDGSDMEQGDDEGGAHEITPSSSSQQKRDRDDDSVDDGNGEEQLPSKKHR